MSDNLKIIHDKIGTDIDPTGAPGSVLAENHRDIEQMMVEKLGKYSGFSYKAIATGTPGDGFFSWQNTPMNTLTDFEVKFNEFTADGTRMLSVFNVMKKGDLIKFKDFLGRTSILIYQSSTGVVEGGEKIFNVIVKGIDSNPSYAYNGTDSFDCVFDFITKGATKTSDLTNDGSTGSNVYLTNEDVMGLVHEGFSESGTRVGGDLIVNIGDHDFSGNETRFQVDDAQNKMFAKGTLINYDGSLITEHTMIIGLDTFRQTRLQQETGNFEVRNIVFPNKDGVVSLVTPTFTTEVNFDNVVDPGVYVFDVDATPSNNFVYTENGGSTIPVISLDPGINFFGCSLRVFNKHNDNSDNFIHITQEFVAGTSGKSWRRQWNGDDNTWSSWRSMFDEGHIGYYENGSSRASGELIVRLGDHDNSGNGTRILIEDEETQVIIHAINGVTCTGNGSFATVNSRGQFTISKLIPSFMRADININNITADRLFELPDQSGTFALLSDIPSASVPTLDQVTTAGNTSTNDVFIQSGGNFTFLRSGSGFITVSNGTETGNLQPNLIALKNSSNFTAGLRANNLTANRNFEFPDNDGVLATKNNWSELRALISYNFIETNSGLLVAGKEYYIDSLEPGDDFSNVGGVVGSNFIATGTTPTNWTNGTYVTNITESQPEVLVKLNTFTGVSFSYIYDYSVGLIIEANSGVFTENDTGAFGDFIRFSDTQFRGSFGGNGMKKYFEIKVYN